MSAVPQPSFSTRQIDNEERCDERGYLNHSGPGTLIVTGTSSLGSDAKEVSTVIFELVNAIGNESNLSTRSNDFFGSFGKTWTLKPSTPLLAFLISTSWPSKESNSIFRV